MNKLRNDFERLRHSLAGQFGFILFLVAVVGWMGDAIDIWAWIDRQVGQVWGLSWLSDLMKSPAFRLVTIILGLYFLWRIGNALQINASAQIRLLERRAVDKDQSRLVHAQLRVLEIWSRRADLDQADLWLATVIRTQSRFEQSMLDGWINCEARMLQPQKPNDPAVDIGSSGIWPPPKLRHIALPPALPEGTNIRPELRSLALPGVIHRKLEYVRAENDRFAAAVLQTIVESAEWVKATQEWRDAATAYFREEEQAARAELASLTSADPV